MSEETDAEAIEAPEVTAAVSDQPDDQTTDDGVEGDEPEDQPEAAEPDLEEIDWEGKKLRIPAELKPALMRQEDYTRKTQEVAETRKALEAQGRQQAESFEALKVDYGKVHALENQVKAYEGVNWNNEFAADADNARLHYDQFRILQDQLGTAKSDLSKKEAERLESQRTASAKAAEETGRVLARDIKGWSREHAASLVTLAAEFGVSQDELLSAPNPRDWKLLHELHTLRQQVKKQTTAQRQVAATSVQPAKTVGAKSNPPTGLDDRLSTAEWVKRRNAQEAAKRRA